jgi:hypothetical protein
MRSPSSSTTSATHTDVDEPRTDPAEEDSPLAQLEKAEAKVGEQELPERWRSGKPVLCIPGPSLLDEALADGVELICLCYLEAATPAQIRYAIRRIRRRVPEAENALIDLLKKKEAGERIEPVKEGPTQMTDG